MTDGASMATTPVIVGNGSAPLEVARHLTDPRPRCGWRGEPGEPGKELDNEQFIPGWATMIASSCLLSRNQICTQLRFCNQAVGLGDGNTVGKLVEVTGKLLISLQIRKID